MIYFVYPWLALLFFAPFLMRAFFKSDNSFNQGALKVPFLKDFSFIAKSSNSFNLNKNLKAFSKSFLFLLLIWSFLVLALMRPVSVSEPIRLQNKGRDILLVTDISTSMLEEDFSYQGRIFSRLDAVRVVVADFVQKRLNDRLGLVLFGTRAYLQVPLTFDKKALFDVLSSMQAGMAGQSTSIGDAVALALKTLNESKTDKQNQVIILLTDGESNDGNMSFAQALKLAKDEGIKIYTIGVGAPSFSIAQAFFGIQNSDLDEEGLKKLAEETKGRYFKVTNLSELADVYEKIDDLELQDYEQSVVYPQKELYFWPLLVAVFLFMSALFFSLLENARRSL
ncbi:MAG: VWA domain-containing protein [Alphaproteobacteria bacterium]|nr:VWA domain-containing protein [Alphaproteobacteria bacterium]